MRQRPPEPAPSLYVERLIRARVLLPIDALLAATAVVCLCVTLAGGQVPSALQYAPFVLSLVVFGLPHGAIDHLVPSRLGLAARPTGVIAVVAIYLLLGALVLTAWHFAPGPAFVGFVLLTWAHWGQGDLFTAVAIDGLERASQATRASFLLARGGIPMLVPLIAHPGDYRGVLAATTSVLPTSTVSHLDPVFGAGFRITVAVGLAIVTVVAALLVRRGAAGRARTTVAETLLLVAYFAVVPPILAVGLYFCLWHALQHIVRLQLLDPRSARALRNGRVVPALVRFARAAAPLTLVALALLVVLALATGVRQGPADLLGTYLVLISALTLPHAAVVALMDVRQRVWSAGAASPVVDRTAAMDSR